MRQYYRDKKKLLRTLSSETAESLLKQSPATTFEQFEMHTHRIIVEFIGTLQLNAIRVQVD